MMYTTRPDQTYDHQCVSVDSLATKTQIIKDNNDICWICLPLSVCKTYCKCKLTLYYFQSPVGGASTGCPTGLAQIFVVALTFFYLIQLMLMLSPEKGENAIDDHAGVCFCPQIVSQKGSQPKGFQTSVQDPMGTCTQQDAKMVIMSAS